MTADVGVSIEDYEIITAAVQDQIGNVVAGSFPGGAEKAGILSRLFRIGLADVLVSPGTPQSFHSAIL